MGKKNDRSSALAPNDAEGFRTDGQAELSSPDAVRAGARDVESGPKAWNVSGADADATVREDMATREGDFIDDAGKAASTSVEASGGAEALAGLRSMVRRGVIVYALAIAILAFGAPASWTLGVYVFTHIPFTQGAPVLTVGATVAIGLHVAVYNLSHEKDTSTFTPQVVARLELFSTAGVVVACLTAMTGLLMILPPESEGYQIIGIQVIGACLSALVTLLACLVGYIVPAGALKEIEDARHREVLGWLVRAEAHWSVGPVNWRQHVRLLAVVAVPLLILVVAFDGWSRESLVLAFRGIGWAFTPAVLTVLALWGLVMRAYALFAIAALGTLGMSLGLAIPLWKAGVLDWEVFAAALALSWPWLVLVRSAMSPRRHRRLLVPRSVRWLIATSLRRRQRSLTDPKTFWVPRLFPRFQAWFRAATGRELTG